MEKVVVVMQPVPVDVAEKPRADDDKLDVALGHRLGDGHVPLFAGSNIGNVLEHVVFADRLLDSTVDPTGIPGGVVTAIADERSTWAPRSETRQRYQAPVGPAVSPLSLLASSIR